MENYKQTADVFGAVADFQQRVQRIYGKFEDQAERERVQMLLSYLQRHERRFADALADYSRTPPDDENALTMETWFQFVPEGEHLSLEGIDLDPDMSVDELVGVAMELDDRLIRFFDGLAANPGLPPNLKSLIGNVKSYTEEQKRSVAETARRIKRM